MQITKLDFMGKNLYELEAGGIFITFDSAEYKKALIDEPMSIQLYEEFEPVAIIRMTHIEEFKSKFSGTIEKEKV